MNSIPVHRYWEALGGWMWETTWQVMVLVGLVLVAQWAGRQWLPARWRYALWMLVVARLLMPWIPTSAWSVYQVSDWVPFAEWQTRRGEQGRQNVPDTVTPGRTLPNSEGAEHGSAGDLVEREPTGVGSWSRGFQWVWMIGALVTLGLVLGKQMRWARLLRGSVPVTDEKLARIMARCQAAMGLKGPVSMVEVDMLDTPALWGWRRPALLLPKGFVARMTGEELEWVIRHELTHVRRRDIPLNWLLLLLQALHWFNPFVWLAFRRLRTDRELVCDETVLRGANETARRIYGGVLLKVAADCAPGRACPGLVPIMRRSSELKRRITHISRGGRERWSVSAAGFCLLVVLGGLTLTKAADQTSRSVSVPEAAIEERPRESREHLRLKVLEEEVAKFRDKVLLRQSEVDLLKETLGVSALDELRDRSGGVDPLLNRTRVERLRVESRRSSEELDVLIGSLRKLNRSQLHRAIPTAVPDEALRSLLDQQAREEQRLSELSVGYTSQHPEVQAVRRRLDRIQAQIEDRIDGVLLGLEAQAAARKAAADRMDVELERARERELENRLKHRPYFEAKREWETERAILERLELKLLQEKFDRPIPANE